MGSDPTFDADALARPLPGDSPGGAPLSDALRRELDALRKETDPDFHDPKEPVVRADWPKIAAATTAALSGTGKDLAVAARLTEASTKLHAAAGLRDGLRLLRRLIADGWEWVHPLPDPTDGAEARRGRLDWLNDSGRGAKLPAAVMRLPLVRGSNGEAFGVADTLSADRKAALDAAIPACPPDHLRRTFADLTAAKEELTALAAAADEKFGADAPNLTGDSDGNLGTALDRCLALVRDAAHRRGVPLGDEPTPVADASPAGAEVSPTAARPATVGGTRDQLYAQIQQVAAALKRIEPHSPIPYLLERCVRLGGLPFPDLMREVIREGNTLDELDRLLGTKKE